MGAVPGRDAFCYNSRINLRVVVGEAHVKCLFRLEMFLLQKAVLHCTAVWGGEVTIPGGVPELWHCRTWSLGMVGWAGVRPGDLRGVFQPEWFCDCVQHFANAFEVAIGFFALLLSPLCSPPCSARSVAQCCGGIEAC